VHLVPVPKAVLLDVGGVLLLPDHEPIRAAFARAGVQPTIDDLDRAHYTGATQLGTDIDHDGDFSVHWKRYLDAYVTACGVPDELREEVHRHLDSEYATIALWSRIAPGSLDGLRALADTGVRLGVVSNADGTIETQLREREILQVGPGLGVEVECIIDSGAVGVEKPNPRIFHLALDAMGIDAQDAWYVGDMPGIDVVGARAAGLRPFLMDPYSLHLDADYDRVASLSELAELVAGQR
jgi:putative hydrolase of the HAD superfamily